MTLQISLEDPISRLLLKIMCSLRMDISKYKIVRQSFSTSLLPLFECMSMGITDSEYYVCPYSKLYPTITRLYHYHGYYSIEQFSKDSNRKEVGDVEWKNECLQLSAKYKAPLDYSLSAPQSCLCR